jgi:hypothetical protein
VLQNTHHDDALGVNVRARLSPTQRQQLLDFLNPI